MTKKGGRIVMGNWIPNDPTLVTQILKISSAYSPPPPECFVSPMKWGVEADIVERFQAARVKRENIACVRDTYVFACDGPPSGLLDRFQNFYGPTMNAFEAAEKTGRAAELRRELEVLFNAQNVSGDPQRTYIPATFLRVNVTV
ncbi:MAG: hypothetical protein M0D54_05630 [Hyphomonadaceae bacterium JAD_PAG50586_4]|nr:MAG: hypothetical protein M0D54_05630 [Hyphomonadaceae bacterium JAD_PAG50586_4]